jgi:hypothetical protein
VQVIVDATNSNTALIASGYISQIALGFAQEYAQDRMAALRRSWQTPDAIGRT